MATHRNGDLYSGYDTDGESSVLMDNDYIRHAMKTSYTQRKVPFPLATKPTEPKSPVKAGSERAYTGLTAGAVAPANTGYFTQDGDSSKNRPLTAVRAAGFSRNIKGVRQSVCKDTSITNSLYEESPQESNKKLEQDVIRLIEESTKDLDSGDKKMALEKAKKAVTKEKLLVRHREIQGIETTSCLDVSYSVKLNLAILFEANDMPDEAMDAYYDIIKNKAFPNAGKLRVNLGNLYFKQNRLAEAIKEYRRALDHISADYLLIRSKILMNIGSIFVKLEQYSEAVSSYEHIMKKCPNYRTAFNLLLCFHALVDTDKTKRSFQRLLETFPIGHGRQDIYAVSDDNIPALQVLRSAIRSDSMKKIEDKQQGEIEKFILQGARLIAPYICETEAKGFEWCVEAIKASTYRDLAAELEISKAMVMLRKNDFVTAVQTLKDFEKKSSKIASHAANNLSFLYFLKNDLKEAERYIDEAVENDTYNYRAYVNKGNIMYKRCQYAEAIQFYNGALEIESDCVEAHYNLGLTFKTVGNLKMAEKYFEKYNSIMHWCPEVLYQLAMISLAKQDMPEAIDRLSELLSIIPNDPAASQELSNIYWDRGEENTAYQYMYKAFESLPCDVAVIIWIAHYFYHHKNFEKAAQFFERAIMVEPKEVKWYLFIASCQQRSGMYHEAFVSYRVINTKFPNNVTCLTLIVKLCRDLGLKELKEYEEKLKKAEDLETVRPLTAVSRSSSAPKPKSKSHRELVSLKVKSKHSIREKSAPPVVLSNKDKPKGKKISKKGSLSTTLTHTSTPSTSSFGDMDVDELVPDCSSNKSINLADKMMVNNDTNS